LEHRAIYQQQMVERVAGARAYGFRSANFGHFHPNLVLLFQPFFDYFSDFVRIIRKKEIGHVG